MQKVISEKGPHNELEQPGYLRVFTDFTVINKQIS